MKNYKNILQLVYGKYNPEKINRIDDLLENYSDMKEELLKAVFKKYSIPDEEQYLLLSGQNPYEKTRINAVEEKEVVPEQKKGKRNYRWIFVVLIIGAVIAVLFATGAFKGSEKASGSDSTKTEITKYSLSFEGEFGTAGFIYLNINIDDTLVSGRYFDKRDGTERKIEGTLHGDELILHELWYLDDGSEWSPATFSGKIAKNSVYQGVWNISAYEDIREFNFKLNPVFDSRKGLGKRAPEKELKGAFYGKFWAFDAPEVAADLNINIESIENFFVSGNQNDRDYDDFSLSGFFEVKDTTCLIGGSSQCTPYRLILFQPDKGVVEGYYDLEVVFEDGYVTMKGVWNEYRTGQQLNVEVSNNPAAIQVEEEVAEEYEEGHAHGDWE